MGGGYCAGGYCAGWPAAAGGGIGAAAALAGGRACAKALPLDAHRTLAIKEAFGPQAYKIPISSPKSMVGHTLGAAGALSAIAAVGAIRDGWIAPTINYHEPDPDCDLDYVPNAKRQSKVDTAMINGFGFGGQNAVAIFKRFEANA